MARRQSLEQAKRVLETEGSLVWLGISVWGIGTACCEVFEIGEEYGINFMCLGSHWMLFKQGSSLMWFWKIE